MSKLSTTKMSSKGQVVIPEDIRKRLKLKEGSQFIVIGEKDVVILKSIRPPSIKDFDEIITRARKQAKKSGMKKTDISAAIAGGCSDPEQAKRKLPKIGRPKLPDFGKRPGLY